MSKATDVVYVRYQTTDLKQLETFLVDFGMKSALPSDGLRLLMRGTGDAPFVYEAVLGDSCKFLGAGLRVSSRSDLDRLSSLPGSGPIHEIDELPGAGLRVRMRMADGFEIDALYGGAGGAGGGARADFGFNSAANKQRRNRAVRVEREAWPVKRLGHFVLHVTDHAGAIAWLQERFGLLASDYLGDHEDESKVVGTFLRVDGGREYVDHHCMLVIGTPEAAVHHCSFEVDSLDAVMCAHDFLLDRGYTLDCGVGRHLLGSQIFDYWRDPFGFRIEHYTDGDIVNDEHQPTVFSGTADETTQWGAKPPKDFFE